jgi:hypothetical protein
VQSQISSVTRGSGSSLATATLNGYFGGSNSGTIWVYNTGDASLNVDALTAFTITPGSTPTLTYMTNSTAASTQSQGFMMWCQGTAGSAGSARDGVAVTDITNALASSSKEDWTEATFANSNTDLGGAAYNTCAEAVSGGQFVSSSPYVGPLNGPGVTATGVFNDGHGGVSPGITLYTGTATYSNLNGSGVPLTSGDLVVWPNQGNNLYVVHPLPGSRLLQCGRVKFACTGACVAGTDSPANTHNNGTGTGANNNNSTWGTWHRFAYYPQPDVFFLVNAPDQPARILRIH